MAGLKKQALGGMQWALGGRLVRAGLGIFTLAIVSRYLTPAEFGVVALATFISGFAQILVDFGLRAALVQQIEVTRRQQNTVFWTNLTLAIVMMALTWFFAGWVARLFDAGRTEDLVRALSLLFPITAIQIVSVTVIERKFAFHQVAKADVVSTVASSIAVILCAVSGLGIWSLIVQQLVIAGVSTALFVYYARWRPRLEYSFDDLKKLFSYSGYVALTNVATFFSGNLDRPIISGVISPHVLGYFTMSQQLIGAPFRVVVLIAKRVLFPILSSLQKDKPRLGAAYLDVQHAIVAIMAPACLGIGALAHPLVNVLLGPQWAPTAPIIQIVAVQLMLFPVAETNAMVLAAVGRARFQFLWMIFGGGISLAALWFAIPHGIIAGVAARTAVTVALMPILSAYTQRKIGLPVSSLMRVLAPPYAAAGLMFVGVSLIEPLLPFPAIVKLIICIPLGAAIYAGLMLLVDRKRVLENLRMLKSRR